MAWDSDDDFGSLFDGFLGGDDGGELPGPDAGEDELLEAAMKLMLKVFFGLLQQSSEQCDTAEQSIDALDTFARSKGDLDFYRFFSICRFQIKAVAELLRAVRFLAVGQFARVEARCDLIREYCDEGIDLCTQLEHGSGGEKLPGDVLENVLACRYMFMAFRRQMAALTLQAAAENLGYQGLIHEYLSGLRAALEELRQGVQELSRCPVASAMAFRQLLTTACELLESRISNFEVTYKQRRPYLAPNGTKALIISAHADAKWRELRSLLEDEWQLETVVLCNEATASPAVMEKFAEHAKDCSLAFVLLTADHRVDREGVEYPQAHANAMFEIGWFCGRFGPSRLCVLARRGTSIPSYLREIAMHEFDETVAELYPEIQGELRKASLIPAS